MLHRLVRLGQNRAQRQLNRLEHGRNHRKLGDRKQGEQTVEDGGLLQFHWLLSWVKSKRRLSTIHAH
ncbi:hypothetical protein [Devosia sp. 1566]|uniref:hypothetical protein n=1 Tax=Devosia sp. 1566 TaxID=2499144 RepID=UPI000FD7B391|nr:hypothetical protein [Devosia sp. 1566]